MGCEKIENLGFGGSSLALADAEDDRAMRWTQKTA
jgi:hypothetical protein